MENRHPADHTRTLAPGQKFYLTPQEHEQLAVAITKSMGWAANMLDGFAEELEAQVDNELAEDVIDPELITEYDHLQIARMCDVAEVTVSIPADVPDPLTEEEMDELADQCQLVGNDLAEWIRILDSQAIKIHSNDRDHIMNKAHSIVLARKEGKA